MSEIPEWVHVWGWARTHGETRWFPQQHENQQARNTIGKEHRNQMRELMDWPGYEKVREEWLAASAPKASIDALLGV